MDNFQKRPRRGEEKKMTREEIKAKRQEFLDQLFGKPKSTNIWGKQFSIFSFFFLLAMGIFVWIGVQTGAIDLEQQMKFRPETGIEKHPSQVPKDTTKGLK